LVGDLEKKRASVLARLGERMQKNNRPKEGDTDRSRDGTKFTRI